MTVQDKATIKSYFIKGAKPTQQQYINLIDSYQDTGSSDAFTAIGQALVNASTQASARFAIGIDFVTTAQAVAGAIATGGMNPVLVKNQIENYGYTTGGFATTAAAVSGQAATGYMNPVLVRNVVNNLPDGVVKFSTIATSVMATSADISSGTASKIIPADSLKAYLDVIFSPLTSYTPTFTALGTVTVSNVRWSREGRFLKLTGSFTSGIATGSEARISLPGSLTVDNNAPSIAPYGVFIIPIVLTGSLYILAEPGAGYITFGVSSGSTAGSTKAVGTDFAAAGRVISFEASIPIQGW